MAAGGGVTLPGRLHGFFEAGSSGELRASFTHGALLFLHLRAASTNERVGAWAI